jgi:hypothetical protein
MTRSVRWSNTCRRHAAEDELAQAAMAASRDGKQRRLVPLSLPEEGGADRAAAIEAERVTGDAVRREITEDTAASMSAAVASLSRPAR